MENKTSLYFVAALPGQELQEEVTQIKEYFANHYQSKHALKSPPHVTVQMPFYWPDHLLEKLSELLRNFSKHFHSFPLRLKDFGAFPPRVIYVHVEPSKKLEKLKKALTSFFEHQIMLDPKFLDKRPYTPHMTVAFKDLQKEQFKLAWAEFKEKSFSYDFKVNALSLLKHDGTHWEVIESFPFGSED
ncbi:2'-5' RNA ligase family protein [Rapidithrix thailandica]|uniref:2'-5' RNA ligase family protein n=1 Tax=Rapidithrix thailandica TaxID=413964 RepID=A0AAW9SDJ6_9BACT